MTATDTETPIPDLSIMATISRAELVAIVSSFGLDLDDVGGISISSEDIVVKTRRGYRVIRVVDEWEIQDVAGEPCS